MTVVQRIIDKYGEPGADYQAKYCELWEIQNDFSWFPAKKIEINKDFKAKLMTVFMNLEEAGLHTEIKTFDGCYNDRNVRGKDTTSLHAWSLAIDLNASRETLGQKTTNWSGRFIAIMEAAGLYWGFRWKRHDGMHFALFNG